MLEAYARSVLDGEDRLTELLATVLQHDQEAALRLAEAAGADASDLDDVTVEVSTQESFVFGRLDLEVLLRAADGTIATRVWFENKIWARFQPRQLERYGEALAERPGRGQLCVLAPAAYEIRQPTAEERARWGGWSTLTWARVAEVLADAQFGALRRKPLADRTAVEQLRLELIEDLRRKGLALMDPVGHLDVITVGREAHTREVLEDLWNRAVQAVLDPGRYSDNGAWDGGSFTWSQSFEVAGGADGLHGFADRWLTTHEGWLDLLLSPDDFWSDDRAGEPAFGAGIIFEHKKGRTVRDDIGDPARAQWRADLREAGFSVLITGSDSYVRVYRTYYLAELLSAGASLDQQARAMATWVTRALDELLALPPSPPWGTSAPHAST